MTGGARVVALGGGHGLATSLEALWPLTAELTAVVSVADDGGSSGRLRRELGIIAPGDMRRCLAALTPPGLVRNALDHRFADGPLAGHSAGNLLLAALLENTDDPVEAMDAAVAMVGARGRILPACRERVDLVAETDRGVVKGQVAVAKLGRIDRVYTSPADPPVPGDVLDVIARAELIVLGPGSLYTSVLAVAVPAIRDAIETSPGRVVYVANLGPEPAETPGYTLQDHIDAVRRHGIEPAVVLADVAADGDDDPADPVLARPLAGPGALAHDPELLGRAFSELVARVET